MKGIYRYDATTLEFNGLIPLSFFANKVKYISGDMFLTITPGDKVFNLCDSKGAVLQSFMDQDLANSGLKTVQFVTIDGDIVSPVADTNSAVCYDVVNDEFSIRDIVSPEYDELVTMGINQRYFEQYGEMEYSDKIMDNFVGIGSFVNIGNFTILSLRYPGIKNAIAISTDSGTKEYIIWPESENVIEDDIFGKRDVSFLLTFGNCESNDSFLFFVENDDPDLNPSILEVKTLK